LPGGVCIRVKVCGITRAEDARVAEDCGADAIGVVMFSDSPRSVPPGRAREILSSLAPSTMGVIVTHTTSDDELEEILSLCPDAVQVSHPFSFPARHDFKVFRMVKRGDPLITDADAFVVDESHGSGKRYDTSFACEMVKRSTVPVILAGGLTPENVREAIAQVHPDAVDVSSGVEIAPGIKDREKVRLFLERCREAGL
jgi:phosphoribosylanthranilate isomerase